MKKMAVDFQAQFPFVEDVLREHQYVRISACTKQGCPASGPNFFRKIVVFFMEIQGRCR